PRLRTSSPTTPWGRHWPSPTSRTSCTTARSSPPAPRTSWRAIRGRAKSTWARSSRSDAYLEHLPNATGPTNVPAGGDDPAAPAGHPSPPALHAGAQGSGGAGAPRESTPRGGAGGERAHRRAPGARDRRPPAPAQRVAAGQGAEHGGR